MKHFFQDKTTYLWVTILAVISLIVDCTVRITTLSFSLSYIAVNAILLFCMVVMYASFNMGSKEIVKALVASMIAVQLTNAAFAIEEILEREIVETELSVRMGVTCNAIWSVMLIVVFVFHILINRTNNPANRMVSISRIVILLMALVCVVDIANATIMVVNGNNSGLFFYTRSIARIFSMLAVACIEAQVNAFREARAMGVKREGFSEIAQ